MAQPSRTTTPPQTVSGAGSVLSGPPSGRSNSPVAPTSATLTANGFSQPPTSLTSREWVVPPRPKPGRKPATGAPPTKRKAQNRAAQRAFRERRAARVGELEEEIKKIEKEDEEEQTALRGRIEVLEKEIEEYRTSLTIWMQRCRGLEAELAIESAAKQEAIQSSENTSAAPPLPPISQHPSEETVQNDTEPMGCGSCSSISDCRCIQEVINMRETSSTIDGKEASSNKRSHSPAHAYSEPKRVRAEPLDHLETDFTTTKSPNQQLSSTLSGPLVSTSAPSAVADPCGFCTDATTCLCAEMQAAAANEANTMTERPIHRDHGPDGQGLQRATEEDTTTFPSLPRISQLSHITPPPSDTDAPVLASSTPHMFTLFKDSCMNGPGTCFQCRTDPDSTLFCKSLAKLRERRQQHQSTCLTSQENACCRPTGTSSTDCCQPASQAQSDTVERSGPTTEARTSRKEISAPSRAASGRGVGPDGGKEVETQPSQPSILLTCADAYTTLSRHPGYQRAAGEMGNWLPQLQPAPSTNHHPESGKQDVARADGKHSGRGDSNGDVHVEGRPAMEIDAANVMAVLREFDRRFPD